MKKKLSRLLLLALPLSLSLASCAKQPAYTPEGEVYVKTSPSRGDGGVDEVVDITVEKAVYTAEGEITVPIKIGVGHTHWPLQTEDGPAFGYLEVKFWIDIMPREEPTDTLRVDYPDYETEKFRSTDPEERPWYNFFPYYYGEFYPLYRETVEWTIPADASYGYLTACVHSEDPYGNTSCTETVRIYFERIDGEVRFSVE